MSRARHGLVAWVLGGAIAVGVACSATQSAVDRAAGAGTGTSGGSDESGTTESTSGTTENPTDTTPRVRYVGRVDTTDPAGPRVGWPGTRIIVRFKGPSLTVHINERNIDSGPSGYDLIVDGTLQGDPFVPDDGDREYTLASDLAANQEHVVELYRRTEAMVAITQFLGFAWPNGELLAPPPWPNRRVEFLGDSESTGYGIECQSTNEQFSGATEDEHKTFPSLVGVTLNAETHNVAYSGKGVFRNDDNSSDLYADLYPRAVPLAKPQPWAFATWAPDVVWIDLGANDWGPGINEDRNPPDVDAFTAKYTALVGLAREKNPGAHIVCAVEGFLNDDYPAGWSAYTNLKNILKSIVDARVARGDKKVYLHDMPRATQVDLTGCSSHPNAKWHAKAATSVAAKIREITGWK